MVLELIFGFAILAIAVYITIKVIKNIALGVLLIVLVLFASYLILGSSPELQNLPIIGKYIPAFKITTGGVISILKNAVYSIDILSASRDSENNLLIAVANTGRLDVSGFEVMVDNQTTNITNIPKQPLKSGETAVIETDWQEDFAVIYVKTNQTSSEFFKKGS